MSDIVIEGQTSTSEPPKIEVSEITVDVKVQEALFLDDCVVVKLGSDKAEIEKRVSYEDFKSILTSALGRREDEKLEGFSLPDNCFFFAKSSSLIQLSCYYPETIDEITYGSRKMKIKVPNLIISHTLERKTGLPSKIITSKYFCTDLSIKQLPKTKFINALDFSSRIWLSPFSNTYQEGNMCYGGNSMPISFADNNLRGLHYYYQFLFNSPFNNDLGIYALGSGRGDVAEWYNELKRVADTNGPFPYSRLRGYTDPN